MLLSPKATPTTVVAASRQFDLSLAEIEGCVEDGKRGMENALRTKPEHVTIVDDAMHEAVYGVARVLDLDRLALTRALPRVIRSDNGKELCGKTAVAWAYERGARLHLIQPGRPNQNACAESFNGAGATNASKRTGFPVLLHSRTEIETWRR